MKKDITTAIACICIAIGLCSGVAYGVVSHQRALIWGDLHENKWSDFQECSQDQGDAGCDSCYYRVYGYTIDPYTGVRDTTEVTNSEWIKSHQEYIKSK